ncbi:MAG: biopolymer transporter ExbD [Campylobacterales bacterium]|nr:biopolymer transporter ExbD [Campylobacterales bacterium]
MQYDWEEKPELNITPLVDVMLVLLAILMVIAPNIVYEELIRLPQGSAQKQSMQKKPIDISINARKEIKVNSNYFEFASFGDNFFNYAQQMDKQSSVMIRADKSLEYGLVMMVLASVKRAGFSEVSLATDG